LRSLIGGHDRGHRWTGSRLAWSSYYAVVLTAIAVTTALIVGSLLHRSQVGQGTVVLLAAARRATHLEATEIALHSSHQGWVQIAGRTNETVPAAPQLATLAQAELPSGSYDAIRIGSDRFAASLTIRAGAPLPVLVQVEEGIPVHLYPGQEQLNLGLQQLSGELPRIPAFDLVDQYGRPFTNASIKGHVVVLAAFHTTCHQTCPLYTGLFLQLRRRVPRNVMLVEATVDPWDDTPEVLRQYAQAVGADWTFVTGSLTAMESFWRPFDVQLSNGDVHSSILAIIDPDGGLRTIYQGVPAVGSLPSPLRNQLLGPGLQELKSGGDGWTAAQVTDSIENVVKLTAGRGQATGLVAPDFEAPALDGGQVSLERYRGSRLVLSFFASYCVPCRTELPVLQEVGKARGVAVLLVDERDDAASARAFLVGARVTLPAVQDPEGVIGEKYRVGAVPETFFITAAGTITSHVSGPVTRSSLESQLARLQAT